MVEHEVAGSIPVLERNALNSDYVYIQIMNARLTDCDNNQLPTKRSPTNQAQGQTGPACFLRLKRFTCIGSRRYWNGGTS